MAIPAPGVRTTKGKFFLHLCKLRQKFPLFFLFALFFLVHLPLAEAFYQQTRTKPFSFFTEHTIPLTESNPACFTVLIPSQRLAPQQAQFLYPCSKNYINDMDIDSARQLTGISHRPVSSENDPVANLLYANLRIKKILDDYRKIQTRARELFGQPQTRQQLTEKKSPSTSKSRKMPSIFMATTKINQELSSLPLPPQDHSSTNGEQKNIHTLYTLNKQWQQLNRVKIDNPLAKREKISSQLLVQNLLNKTTPKETTAKNKTSVPARRTVTDPSDIDMPWLVSLPFKLIDYIIHHKITAAIIVFIVLGVFNLLFGSRSS